MTRMSFFKSAGLMAVAANLKAQAPGQAPASAKTNLKIGDQAPDFILAGTDGKQHRLSDLRGKSTVVVAFFPAAFTGGCTKEMQAYEAGITQFSDANAIVLGISTDPLPSLRHWAEEHLKTSVPLLSDSMRKVSASYGVLNEDRGVASRTTFVLDKNGKIQHIDENAAAIDVSGAASACSRLKKG